MHQVGGQEGVCEGKVGIRLQSPDASYGRWDGGREQGLMHHLMHQVGGQEGMWADKVS